MMEYTSEAALKVVSSDGDLVNQSTLEAVAWTRMKTAFDIEPEDSQNSQPGTDKPASAGGQADEAAALESQRLRANAVVWGEFWLSHF
ncbi:hypothetical protein, partial [Staphylococcus aureus]|uniref:hypothetical protein n=1 Tax=Staphylococcus aureus TaxID=1280 RepID=UPI0039BE1F39